MVHPDAVEQAEMWDQYAREYPDLYPTRDPGAAVSFLADLSAGGGVLELGAGSGRVAVPLAKSGCDVTAVEISPRLCENLAERSAGERVEVVQDDMATFRKGRYDLIYSVHSSLFHVTTQARQLAVLENVRAMLDDLGRFVVSCYHPVEVIGRSGELRVLDFDSKGVSIRAVLADTASQTVEFREFRVGCEPLEVLALRQRYVWPAELDMMALNAGLSLDARYESYDRSPFSHRSQSHLSVYSISSQSTP